MIIKYRVIILTIIMTMVLIKAVVVLAILSNPICGCQENL